MQVAAIFFTRKVHKRLREPGYRSQTATVVKYEVNFYIQNVENSSGAGKVSSSAFECRAVCQGMKCLLPEAVIRRDGPTLGRGGVASSIDLTKRTVRLENGKFLKEKFQWAPPRSDLFRL